MDQFQYHHDYTSALTYKMFHAWKSRPDEILSFEQTLDIIRHVHRLSLGMPQIVYLVGWQYDGHDSRYPAWGEVNPRLGRAQDADALESLKWLMREAKTYNATVSLHLNMCDAYPDSPLWQEYVDADLLNREPDGELMLGGVWDGAQSYLVSKTREWRSGHAQKRIDDLVAMLPLAEAGTVHIDVFRPCPSPYHGVTYEDEVAAMRDILRYWHSLGIDVTQEWFHHEFAGLVPMVYHLNLDEEGRLRYDADVICGGGSAWNKRRHQPRCHAEEDVWMSPELGCMYEEAWGESFGFDFIGLQQLPDFADRFFTKTLSWHFLNRHRVERHVNTRTHYEVHFTDAVRTSVRKSDRHFELTHGDRLLVENTTLLLPVPWAGNTWLAYSREGGTRAWDLPLVWPNDVMLEVQVLGPTGSACQGTVQTQGRRVTLDLAPRQPLILTPLSIGSSSHTV